MKSQRIIYIDFMKGILIILLVAFHINPEIFGDISGFLMMGFFFLSGLFFKIYNGFNDFLRRKINNLIVPLIFFIVIGSIYYFCRNLIENHFDAKVALNQMPQNPMLNNVPMWFLAVLFEVNIIYYLMFKFLPRWANIVVALAFSAIGYVAVNCGYNIGLYFDITMVALPFYVLGHEFCRTGLIERGPHVAVRIVMAVAVAVILYLFAERINMLHRVYPSYFKLYMLPALFIISLHFLSQYIIRRPIPVISYMGRYSIIVLGTHYFLIGPLRLITEKLLPQLVDTVWLFIILLTLVVTLEYPVIYFLRKYCPRLTAQKPFFQDRNL